MTNDEWRMIWLRVVVLRLMALFRQRRLEQELDEELRSHLEMQVDENVRKGISPQEARYAALRRFGGVEQVKEVYREQRGLPMIETLVQDLRYGLRMLAKNPGFTAVAVLTLALGIGSNTAIFSVVNAVMLKPLPFPAADRLVRVVSTDLRANTDDNASYPDVVDWRARNRVFEGMAVFRTSNFTLTGAGEPLRLRGAIVSAELFALLGVTPGLGRSFLPEEDKPGEVNGGNAVILSHGLWQRRFSSDRNVLGRTINLDGGSFTVVGVMPAGFQFPIQAEPVELWKTIAVYAYTRSGAPMTAQRGVHFLNVIARLRSHVTVAQAQSEMSAIVSALNREYPENRPRGGRVVPELHQLVGDVRKALLVFLGAVGCVLLIVCANVANLLSARAAAREKEMCIRAALGASRGRVIRQVLTESILLASLGGVLGLLLAVWGTEALIQLGPADIPRLTQVGLDGRVIAFTALVSLLTGILFSLVPALHVPIAQSPLGLMTVVVRSRAEAQGLISAVRTTLAALDKDPPIYDIRSLDQYLTQSVSQPRFNTLLLSVFAGLALVLAIVGLYGVMAHSVAQRTHEIGIRMALGAGQSDVLRLVVAQGLGLALIGAGIGLAGAFTLTRFLSGMLYGVHPTDPLTFALITLGLLGVAAFASYIPARRAARVDPMVTLRYE